VDASYLSAMSALAGAAVGGLTSFATTFYTQTTQSRNDRRNRERTSRQELYGKFLEELARQWAHAVRERTINHDELTAIFALRGRILLVASTPVATAADDAIRNLVDTMLAPNKTDEELRAEMKSGRADQMLVFAQICRSELQRF
jgi:hypothetical protein